MEKFSIKTPGLLDKVPVEFFKNKLCPICGTKKGCLWKRIGNHIKVIICNK